jgi:3-oxoacyl-[acyl-carrier protein] reductase
MDLGLKGKVAMVAASSKGLGFGIAKALAEEGALLSIGSRTKDDIEAAAEQLRKETGTQVLASVMDSSNPESILKWTNWWSMPEDHLLVNSRIFQMKTGSPLLS